MLISKIRSKSSREFISIMDQVIISEFDALNDQILENRDSITIITESVLSHYQENRGTLLAGGTKDSAVNYKVAGSGNK